MPAEMGEFLGYLIIICYALAVLNYFVKFINKRFRNTLSKHKKFYAIYMQIMKFIIKRHKIFGFATIVFILLHFYVQFSTIGLRISGVAASAIMLLQISLGIYGSKAKKRGKTWLYLHRSVAAVLLIIIVTHAGRLIFF